MTDAEPEALESSEFRLLVEQIEDYAIFLLDPDGHVRTWNDGAERLKGYAASEIVGRHFSTFYPPEARDRELPERELATAIDEGRVEDYGWRVRKDGSRFWAHVVVTAIREGDELVGFGKVTHEVGEDSRVNEVLDRLEDGFAAFDTEFRYTYVNESALEMLGQPEGELLGRKITDVFPEIVETETYTQFTRALRTQEPTRYVRYSDIMDRWVEVRVFPSPSGLSVYFRDVTEQRAQTRQLAEEKALVEQILDVSPVAIVVFDETGTVVRSNERAEELFGGADEQLVGRSVGDSSRVLFDERGPIPDADHPVNVVLEEGRPVRGYAHGIELSDGTQRWLSTNHAPIRDETGEVVRVVTAVEDITALKRHELQLQDQQATLDETIAELERSNAELAWSNAELEHFAYAASHDLREPLRLVSSYLDLLERRYGDRLPEDGTEFLQGALDGALRLERMIDDLLLYSRVTRDFDDVEPVDLADVVEQARKNLTILIDHTGAQITTDDLPTVTGNESLLVQLLQNLLSNAIRYSEGTPRVHVSVEDADREWVVTVHDEGVGIEPEEVNKVFTIFHGNSADGAGIGLAICQKIVELHRGRIWVDSTPGEGSSFHFSLPK